MFGQTRQRYNFAEMDRRMRALERDARRTAGRASATATHAGEQVGDIVDAAANAIASVVQRFGGNARAVSDDVLERFRGNARSMSDDAVRFGHEAARLGNTAVARLSKEVEHRPLTMLALAAGLAFLFGMAGRRS